MPIDANLSFLTPPDVEIVITDPGGGGGSKKRVVDLALSFDPAVLRHVRGAQKVDAKGVLLWRKVKCPSKETKLKFQLARRKAGDTFVVVSALNPFTGKGRAKGLKVPDGMGPKRNAGRGK